MRRAPKAPFVLACNRNAYLSQPLLLAAWRERWRMHGAADDEANSRLAKILDKADPPGSDEAVGVMLRTCGFTAPKRFFSSLFWGAWISTRSH